MSNFYTVKKKQQTETKEDLEKLDKKELIDLVVRLQAHNVQLRNILVKKNNDDTRLNYDSDELDVGEEKNVYKKRSYDFTKCSKRHVLLKFLYLGWDYLGFATQEHSNRTIEYYIFNALSKTCLIRDRQSSNYHRCGRTDKAVSGSAQVISLDVRSKLPSDKIGVDNDSDELEYCKMLNRMLPEDIKCISWCPVPDNYSARFNCISRTYKYYFVKGELNIKAMIEASGYLIGEHDFRNFCKMDVGNGVTNFNRNIVSANIDKCVSSNNSNDSETFDLYVLKITGNGFLWHQIRCIMGILFLVGENKETPDIVKHLLNISEHPRKPQYSPANSIPLIFHDCQFDSELKWKYDFDELKYVILNLQKLWTLNQIKATQIREIISDITNLGVHLPDVRSSGLADYRPANVHKPLLERQTCESLESRIKHYVKKQRIELQEEEIE